MEPWSVFAAIMVATATSAAAPLPSGSATTAAASAAAAPTAAVIPSADRVFSLAPASDWPAWASLGPSPGQTRRVAPTGSDSSGTGSATAPFRTIQRAVDVSNPGDEVLIAAGEYPGEVRVREPRITLRGSVGTGKPHIVVPNQSESSDEIALQIDPDADGTRIIGLNVEGGSYYALSCETKWDWGDPTDRSGATNLVIAYNDLHHSGRDAVKIKPNCDDVLLANNTIHDTGQRDDSNAEGIDNVNGDRMAVLDNHLIDIATTGLYFKGGAADVRVERNLIERVGQGVSPDSAGAGILVGFDTDTDYFDRGQNPGMYEAVRGRVVNNIIDGTTMTGIGVYAARDSLIAHNTIRNCCRDYHAGIAFGISLQSWMDDGLRPASRNVTVWGNLVGVRSSRGEDYGSAIRYLFEPSLGALSAYEGMPAMDYNVYWAATPPVRFSDGRPTSEYDDTGLSGWTAHTGSDGHSLARPFTLDASWHSDVQLPVLPGARYSLDRDFFGTPRSASPMAGAVEGPDLDPTGPPGAPGNVTADAGDARATLRWTASAVNPSDAVGSYSVQEVGGPGGCSVAATAAPLGCTVTGLVNAGSYTFTVRAESARGFGLGEAATVSVVPNGPPPPPAKPTLLAGDQAITVSWPQVSFPHGGTLTRYTATASPGGGTCWVAATATSCTIRRLANGMSYTVVVVATSAAAKSSAASPATEVRLPSTPAIDTRWRQLGGATGLLGDLSGPELEGPLGSRLQRFVRGAIYWSPDTGANELAGAIRTRYTVLPARNLRGLGLPTSGETAGPFGGSRVSSFQRGTIYWSQATGAHEIYGAIRGRYSALSRAQRLRLRLPTTGEYSTATGRANNFQGGRITWTPAGTRVAYF